jgi:predicted TIM-barrel fold metal-dependent hydrolase
MISRMAGAHPADVPTGRRLPVKLIDCDIHLGPRDADHLLGYLPARQRDRFGDRRRLRGRQVYLAFIGYGARLDAIGPNGEYPGSLPEVAKRQLFVDEGADFGLITPLTSNAVDPELNAAIFHAMNAWQADTWLREHDMRLFGSICVPLDDVAAAVRQIDEWSSHPGFKAILIASDSDRPFGHPQYDPIWAAAARHRLPVGVHFNDSNRLTLGGSPVGHYLRYVDFHALARVLEYGAHLVSWINSGVFSRYPEFRVALLEGGFLWHRQIIARLSYQWDAKTADLAYVSKSPLDCLYDNVRFASQPMETAPIERDVAGMLRIAEAEKLLMFSSDYPHYDYDNPDTVLPHGLPDHVTHRIMCENAREFYDLPTHRNADDYDQLGTEQC